MSLTAYLSVFRKHWVSIAVLTFIGLLAAGALSYATQPVFTASASVFLTVQSGGSAGELAQGSTYAENQVHSFAQLVTAPIVLEPVIEHLHLDTDPAQLAKSVSASVPAGTAIVEISATNTNSELAAKTANAVANQMLTTIASLSPSSSGGGPTVRATVVAPASTPASWTTPNVSLNLALGLLAGVVVALAQVVIRNAFDTRVLTQAHIEEVTNRSVIGTIQYDPSYRSRLRPAGTEPPPLQEAYRRLRTNLQFLEIGNRNKSSIVVTSAVPGEGKSATAANLASVIADAGQSVLLIDADLRSPSVDILFDVERAAGLSTIVIGRADLAEVVQPQGNGSLHVLTSGQIPPNPSELLGSDAMKRLLSEAEAQYDVVILDSPPLLPVTDAAILSAFVGGTVVVVGSGAVRKPQLKSALESLDVVGSRVLGLVLNAVKTKRNDNSYQVPGYRSMDADQSMPLQVNGDAGAAARRLPSRPSAGSGLPARE